MQLSGPEVWSLTRRWSWLAGIGLLLGAAAAYLISAQLPRMYAASTRLLVTAGESGVLTGGESLTTDQLVATYVEVLQSRPVVEAAFAEVGVPLAYDSALRTVQVSTSRGTQVIDVTVLAADPLIAARLANQLAVAAIGQARATQAAQLEAPRTQTADVVTELTASVTSMAQRLEQLRDQPAGAARDQSLATAQAALTDAQQRQAAATRSVAEQDLAAARIGDPLSVVELAVPPTRASLPRVGLNVAIGGLWGLVLTLGAILVVEVLSDRLHTPEAVQRRTGLPVWGVVPSARAPSGSRVSARLTLNEQHSIEAFRALRTSLQQVLPTRPTAVLVASSRPGEGTTAVATGLAMAWARAGERVVLVDANVRSPRLGNLVASKSEPDLVTLLEGEPSHDLVGGALRPTAQDRLLVLTCEPERAFARDLVASRRMERLIDDLRSFADRVIVDGAPVSAGETLALAHCVDATLLVIDARRSRGAETRRASAVIRDGAGSSLEGAVLNYV